MLEKKIELFIPGDLKDEPVLCELIKKFSGEIKIIEASFSAESGWAILVLKGKSSEIDDMVEFLEKKGINVETR